MPVCGNHAAVLKAGVRKPPRKEPAGAAGGGEVTVSRSKNSRVVRPVLHEGAEGRWPYDRDCFARNDTVSHYHFEERSDEAISS